MTNNWNLLEFVCFASSHGCHKLSYQQSSSGHIAVCFVFSQHPDKLLLHFVVQPRQETILLFFQLLAGSILYIVYKPFLVSVVSLFLQYLLLPPAAALPDTSAAQNR